LSHFSNSPAFLKTKTPWERGGSLFYFIFLPRARGISAPRPKGGPMEKKVCPEVCPDPQIQESPASPPPKKWTFSGAMQSYSGAMQSYSGAIQSYSVAIQSYSGAIQSYSGAIQSYSGAIQSYSVAIQSYSGAIQSYSGGHAVISRNHAVIYRGHAAIFKAPHLLR